jgi:hypothetical protein
MFLFIITEFGPKPPHFRQLIGAGHIRENTNFVFLYPFLHLQHNAERHGLGFFGLAVEVEKFAVGVDEMDDDCVVNDVVHVVIFGTGQKVDSKISYEG